MRSCDDEYGWATAFRVIKAQPWAGAGAWEPVAKGLSGVGLIGVRVPLHSARETHGTAIR